MAFPEVDCTFCDHCTVMKHLIKVPIHAKSENILKILGSFSWESQGLREPWK
jgi:hypothetical protein